MLIDTHCHLNIIIKDSFDTPLADGFEKAAQALITEALASDVTTLINVGTSAVESANCVKIAQAFPSCFATLGTHPNDLTVTWKDDIKFYQDLIAQHPQLIVGIGEIGLDYHYPQYDKKRQYAGLEAQITLALDHNLPIVIHTRDAGQDLLTVLEHFKTDTLRGIIHCFSEDMSFAQRALDLGFMLGIGGPLTYPKNIVLREVFTTVPLESIVLETDAPFLPPQEFRGKKNSPAHIRTVAHYLAGLRDCSYDEVARVTTHNAQTLFGLLKA